MAAQQSSQEDLKKELVQKIHQFLCFEIESNQNLSEDAKESLTVAAECIQQAYTINRQQPSNELLDNYKQSRQGTNQAQTLQNLMQLFQQFAPNLPISDLINQFGGALQQNSQSGGASQEQSFAQTLGSLFAGQAQATRTASPQTQQSPSAPEREATEEDKSEAEVYKNHGNEFMKQDKFKDALDCYTKAIEYDGNNAVYYSNRAAAWSKLGNHQNALSDCERAIQIDPTYPKAYGRMGLAYVSLNNHQKAKDAYLKAVELDPNNESYKNNLRIAEEQLRRGPAPSVPEFLNNINIPDNATLQNMLDSLYASHPEMEGTIREMYELGRQSFGNLMRSNNPQQPPQPPPGTS